MIDADTPSERLALWLTTGMLVGLLLFALVVAIAELTTI